eukprot:TRINITY_DN15150_c0_g1::TRINITY_DN15150_c0_g1_i1::g.30594::m.30594 TRINITY_DN15150_c0_g1::TRINITY_DN15150_c0_g1_i1::g.30594  ORF type:complete len:115 (+),score=2.52,Root_cap/PF06830.6/0.11 TRINITY_DN15150_c0_g1_i1:105-449(+)
MLKVKSMSHCTAAETESPERAVAQAKPEPFAVMVITPPDLTDVVVMRPVRDAELGMLYASYLRMRSDISVSMPIMGVARNLTLISSVVLVEEVHERVGTSASADTSIFIVELVD